MKTISQILNESIQYPEDSINKISTTELKDYYAVTKKFLSDDGKAVVEWLIRHPKYATELGRRSKHVLGDFMNRPAPEDEEQRELWKNLRKLNKESRLLEVPNFLSKEQFDDILNREISLDEIVLDLKSEKGRNAVVRKYTPLVHHICRQWVGKSNLDYDELVGQGMLGLTYAMNNYGKYNGNDDEDNNKKRKSYTFKSYAAYRIQIEIKEGIKHYSHTVRVADSEQARERKVKGFNTKSHTISGDAPVGGPDKDGNTKSRFDTMDLGETPDLNLNKKDEDELWSKINDILLKKFSKKELDIFYHGEGLWDHEKIAKKDLAKKYKMNSSNISYYIFKIKQFLLTNKECKEIFADLNELYAEDRQYKMSQEQDVYIINDYNQTNYYEGMEDNLSWKISKWFDRDISEKRKFNKLLNKCKKKKYVSDNDIDEYLNETNLLIEKFVQFIEDDVKKIVESDDIAKARADYRYSFKKILEYLVYSNE